MDNNTTPTSPPPAPDTRDTLHELWNTLPPRIPKSQGSNAMLGGVCEGIGARYGVDPVLIRLFFVALTFAFGGGLFIYLLFFLVMPRFGTTVSPWRAINTPKDRLDKVGKSERDNGWALIIALVIFFPTLSLNDGGWAASSLFTVVLALAGVYALHRRQPVPPEGLLARPAGGSTLWQPTRSVDTTHLSVPEGYTHPAAARPAPPSWDPLGTAPELWHLPDLPAEEPEPQPRRRSRGATILSVLGLALVLGIISTAFAAAMGFIFYRSDEVGDVEYTVTNNLQDRYDSSIGTTVLDLSDLAPLDEPRTVAVEHSIGTVEIIPPDNVRVELACDVSLGSDNCPAVLNPDAPGDPLRLDVDLSIGTVSTVGAS
ncbi:PspC domain-containing protein [Corynebacterium sp. LK2510]|uniref:PspC domain-containing protein n=1 Tax=Corynebacterium sp. LK2510 TaxID=3110472 RepID=UPI0034CF4A34